MCLRYRLVGIRNGASGRRTGFIPAEECILGCGYRFRRGFRRIDRLTLEGQIERIQDSADRKKQEKPHGTALARRHRLSRELALAVTDNRITLRDALRRRPQFETPAPPRKAKPVTKVQKKIVFGIAAVFTVAILVHGWKQWQGFVERNNSELVANWGNLVNRVLNMTKRYFKGIVPDQVN